MKYIVKHYVPCASSMYGSTKEVVRFERIQDAQTYIRHLAGKWCEQIDSHTLTVMLAELVEAFDGDWDKLPVVTKDALAEGIQGEGISVALLGALSGDPDLTESTVEERLQWTYEAFFPYWAIENENGEFAGDGFSCAGPNVLLKDGMVKLTIHCG